MAYLPGYRASMKRISEMIEILFEMVVFNPGYCHVFQVKSQWFLEVMMLRIDRLSKIRDHTLNHHSTFIIY